MSDYARPDNSLDGHADKKDIEDYHLEVVNRLPSQSSAFVYPEALKGFANAPTSDMVQRGLSLQEVDVGRRLWPALKDDWRIVAMTLPYLLGAFATGLDNAMINISGAMPAFLIKFGGFDPVRKALNIPSEWLSLWSSLLTMTAFLGTCATPWLLERFGPRQVGFATAIYFILPAALQVFATSRGMLLAGKMLAGFVLGINNVVVVTFIAESCSAKLRPILSAVVGALGVTGLIIGLTIGSQRIPYLNDWLSWRFTLAFQFMPCMLQVIGLVFSVTSPVWLLKKKRPEAALGVIIKLYGLQQDSQEATARLAAIQYALANEMTEENAAEAITYKELLRNPVDRRRLLLSMAVWIVNQLGGTAFLGQGLYFLVQQGVAIEVATDISLGFLALSALSFPLGGYLVNKIGRRGTFIYLNIFHCAVMTAIGVVGIFIETNKNAGWALAILLNFAVTSQSVSTGGSAYAISAEVSSLRARVKSQALGFVAQSGCAWVLGVVMPYIFQAPGYLGAKTSFIFAGATALAIVWSFFYIPETNGMSQEERDACFEARLPARQFAKADIKALMTEQKARHAAAV